MDDVCRNNIPQNHIVQYRYENILQGFVQPPGIFAVQDWPIMCDARNKLFLFLFS